MDGVRTIFADAYTNPKSKKSIVTKLRHFPRLQGRSPAAGRDGIAFDIENLEEQDLMLGALPGVHHITLPGSTSRISNTYYATDKEFVSACADAMREEYHPDHRCRPDPQIDDPSIAEDWDQWMPNPPSLTTLFLSQYSGRGAD